jgi:hypothetical protein
MQQDDGERGISALYKSRVTDMMPDETALIEPEVAPLVVPAALFKPLPYHPMHIFVSIIESETIK